MPIPQQIIDEVKRLNPIEEVVSRYTKLTPSGPNILKGCCIFHREDTPSLTIYPANQTFHCFGCGAGKGGSDVVAFIMRAENLSFPDAVKYLANKVGINIESDPQLDRMYEFQDKRTRSYHNLLWKTEDAIEYLRGRGLTDETIREFMLGFCDNQKDVKMVGRITFPIANAQGRIVGLGGRIFRQGDEREKYTNDASSKIFRKSEMLYQLSKARDSIRANDKVYLVEGYMDYLLSYQIGVKNTLALLSTALTEDHINIIKRYTDNAVFILDGDEAGETATLRHILAAEKAGLNVQIVPMPSKFDPADLIRKIGADAYLDYLEDHEQSAAYYQVNLATWIASGKIAAIQAKAIFKILPVLDAVDSPTTLESLVRVASSSLAISAQTIMDELRIYQEEKKNGKSQESST
jgi:DNA primase